MSRAWIPSLFIVPFAVGTLISACSAGGGPGADDDRMLTGPGGTSPTGNPSGGRSGLTGSGGTSPTGAGGTIMVGGPVDPCEMAGIEDEDCMVMRQPGCGDGMVNQAGEECDDGNSFPGDCCSGSCTVEQYCDCSGGTCVSTIVCGDGMRGPGEACDDGNATGGDGCSEDCHVVEIGYRCPTPGMMCERHYVCGDSSHDANEGCDDGNIIAGDGCSDHCRIELGWKCEGTSCSPTTCGDGVAEGAESCDEGDIIPFDGCSPDCRAEPVCVTGQACTSSCGDGIVFGDEQCDDGNVRDGDGCSSSCAQEEGYVCDNNPPCARRMGVDPVSLEMGDICSIEVPAIFRDFNGHSATGGHPDFAPGYNSPGAIQGLVKPTLDAEGKPELVAADTDAYLHSVANFKSWYRSGAPSTPEPVASSIVLWDKAGIAGDGTAGYVNRWGANGEQWMGPITQTAYEPIVYGGPAGGGCEACTPTATGMCYDPCTPWGAGDTSACCAEVPRTPGYDGNPLFFPIDSGMNILTEARVMAQVPEQYWGSWTNEPVVADTLGITTPIETATAPFPSATHNFNFTSEVKYWFKYDASATATLEFTGDDDVWVFLNGRLAVDLGAWHVPLNGTLTIGANIQTRTNLNVMMPMPTVVMDTSPAAEFGLEDGNVYQIAVFHAEREKTGSSFKLTLAGFNMSPSDCRTNCGDAMVGPGEECDDGTNRGAYNECAPGCLLGPRCGDAVVQGDYGEVCDDGVNAGNYGGCGADCQPGPRCGDAVVTPGMEECDDGMNAGNYGGCDVGCKIGPHCGDGFISSNIDPNTGYPYEECDDMNDTPLDGCSSCKIDVVVPK